MNEGRHEIAVIRKNGAFLGIIDTENVLEFVMIRGALQKKQSA
jgi:CBS-domain-containing membrane protein